PRRQWQRARSSSRSQRGTARRPHRRRRPIQHGLANHSDTVTDPAARHEQHLDTAAVVTDTLDHRRGLAAVMRLVIADMQQYMMQRIAASNRALHRRTRENLMLGI